ncbi:Selenoprotein P [Lemmus lemmus]
MVVTRICSGACFACKVAARGSIELWTAPQRVKRTSAMWRSLGLALALCLLPYGGAESQGQSPACKQPPAWKIGDEDPMLNSEGTVTVVALLQAS